MGIKITGPRIVIFGVICLILGLVTAFVEQHFGGLELDEAISASPELQKMFAEIKGTEKYDFLVDEYKDDKGKDQARIILVYGDHRDKGFIRLVFHCGAHYVHFQAKDLVMDVDRVVKSTDPDYPEFAVRFIKQQPPW